MARRLAAVLLMLALAGATARAEQRTWTGPDGKSRTFFGFVQYCNPLFLQLYVGQLGSSDPVSVRVLRGRGNGRGGTDWTELSEGKADGSNAEGEVTLGFRCGYAVDFAFPPGRVRAGDLIHVQISRTADGKKVRGWTLFDRSIGTGGPTGTPEKGEGQGSQGFQGRIVSIRPDSATGYALDDLVLLGGGRVFYPLQIVLEIGRRKLDSKDAFEKFDEVATEAAEEQEIPLYQTAPGSPDDKRGTWKVGFTANFNKRLEPGFEYQLSLSQTSLNKVLLDRRTVRITSEETLPVIADYSIGKGEDARGGKDLELVREWKTQKNNVVLERMTTRALLNRDEFYRRTPDAKEGAGPAAAGERLYAFEGEGSGGLLGGKLEIKRQVPPAPRGEATFFERAAVLDDIDLRAQGRARNGGKGGFDAEATRSVWAQASAETDPAKRRDGKVYVYEWAYVEPYFEKYVNAIFTDKKLPELEKTWSGIRPPVPLAGNVVDPDFPDSENPTGPTTPTTGVEKDAVGNEHISIYLTPDNRPIPWKKLPEEKKAKLVATYGAKLDEKFNKYSDLEFTVGAYSKKAVESAGATGNTTNPSQADSKSAKLNIQLSGDHAYAWYDDPEKKNHPLFISVRYVYDKAFEAIGRGGNP